MALTFPMSLDDFFGKLPIQSIVPDLGEAYDFSQTGAGEILTADLGPRLWKADVTVPLGTYASIEQIKARLNVLRQAGRSLFVFSIPLPFPQYDPDGSRLGGNTISLFGVAPNNREISLTGFPPGYRLTAGDKLSFQYGSNPARYAFHEVVVGKTAGADGIMYNIEIGPFVRPGYSLGATVVIKKPFFKAIIVPGSTKIGATGQQNTAGLTFSLVQTLR